MESPLEEEKPLWRRLQGTTYFAWHVRGQARWPFRPLKTILAAQSRRVRGILRHAYRTVPYYRRTLDRLNLRPADFRTAADLARLPLIDPAELRAEPEQFISEIYSPKACVRLFSSGSTGHPRATLYPVEAILQNAAHGERERAAYLPLLGRRCGYRETVIGAPISADNVFQEIIRTQVWVPSGMPIRRQYLSVLDPPEKNLLMINEFRPDVIRSLGSYLAIHFGYLAQRGGEFHKPRVITYSSDALPAPIRRIIEKNFNIPVFSAYEAIEALKIGFECEENVGLHANIDLYPVRVVAENGRALPPGQMGEMVISNLVNRAQVLLNYRLGDLACWKTEPCGCGRSLPLLEHPPGRRDDSVRLPSGRVVHPLVAKAPFLDEPEIWQYQVVQESPARFSARVIAAPGADRTAMTARLTDRFHRDLDGEIHLTVHYVDRIDRTRYGKSRDFVSVFEAYWNAPDDLKEPQDG